MVSMKTRSLFGLRIRPLSSERTITPRAFPLARDWTTGRNSGTVVGILEWWPSVVRTSGLQIQLADSNNNPVSP